MRTAITRRLRPILAGLVVLILSGGAAFAGQPTDLPVDGRAMAAERSGLEIPPLNPAPTVEDEDEPEGELDEEAPEANVEADAEGENEHCVDPATLTPEVLAETNHGAIVCWAAHQETPDGYANHGAWVSEWAKKNHGHEDTAGDESETVTPEATVGHGKSQGKAKGPNR